MQILMISGSRNSQGQTAQAADAVLQGVQQNGGDTARVFLPQMHMERCRQCEDNGWGICRSEGKCIIEDDFAGLVQRIEEADAVIFANPVYFSDLSESMRAFTDRLRRTCTNQEGRKHVENKTAMGVCVAGGGGGGAPECTVSLKRVLTISGFDVIDVTPVRRQNLENKCKRLHLAGQWLTEMTGPRSG